MFNYQISSLSHNNDYSEYILPVHLINYITPFVDKKCEIDPIKNTIEAESSKKTEVSMTQFLCFTGRPCFYYPLLSRLKKKAKLVETLLATVS
jgi:hypothetical protein